jgi:hypothetical protein
MKFIFKSEFIENVWSVDQVLFGREQLK